jgi:hypothetical protein
MQQLQRFGANMTALAQGGASGAPAARQLSTQQIGANMQARAPRSARRSRS